MGLKKYISVEYQLEDFGGKLFRSIVNTFSDVMSWSVDFLFFFFLVLNLYIVLLLPKLPNFLKVLLLFRLLRLLMSIFEINKGLLCTCFFYDFLYRLQNFDQKLHKCNTHPHIPPNLNNFLQVWKLFITVITTIYTHCNCISSRNHSGLHQLHISHYNNTHIHTLYITVYILTGPYLTSCKDLWTD